MAVTDTSKILETVKSILGVTPRKEMHVSEIADKAISLNKNLGLNKEDLVRKLSAVLSANAKSKTGAIVLKARNPKTKTERRGYYKLKRVATGPTHKISYTLPTVGTLFSGAAGEYAVASELLFWGFNVAKPMVDMGIDLVCQKDNLPPRYVQVKTNVAKASDATSFSFKIDASAVEACSQKSPWYVFVMRSGREVNFAIIPNDQLILWRKYEKIKGKDFSITITRNERKDQYMLNDTEDINPFINNFKIMESMI